MGRLTGLLKRSPALSGLANPSPWLIDQLNSPASTTGLNITEITAMNSTAVYSCVKILAETVGTLPLPLYRRLGNDKGKERATDHYLYRLLHDQPNPEMTSVEFREAMMASLALWGNAYALIQRDADDLVEAIWPLRPERMRIWRDTGNGQGGGTGELQYQYSLYRGGIAYLSPHEVHHVRSFSQDGIKGYMPVNNNREAIGLDVALQQFAASLFGNGAMPGGVLTHPDQLSAEARERMRASWEDKHKGLDNAHRIAILEEGVTWQAIGIPPEAAQFMHTRQFQLNEVGRIWRIPPHLLGELTRSTNNNIEHQSLEFVIHTIRPICVRWEQAMVRDLLHEDERAEYYPEFNVDGLLRGDLLSRYQSYAVGRQWGFLSVNDIRDRENLNPIGKEGEIYLQPVNMMDAAHPMSLMPSSPLGGRPPIKVDGGAGQPDSESSGTSSDGGRSAFHGLFIDAAQKALKREEADVLRVVRTKKGDALSAALDKVYGDYAEYMDRQFAPLCEALGSLGGDQISIPTQTSERQVRALLAQGAGLAEIQSYFDTAREEFPARLASSIVAAPAQPPPSSEDRLMRTLEAAVSREIPAPVVNFHADAIKTEVRASASNKPEDEEEPVNSEQFDRLLALLATVATREQPTPVVNINEGAFRAGDVHVAPPQLNVNEGAIRSETHVAAPAAPAAGKSATKRKTTIIKDRQGNVLGTETEEVP